MEGWRGGGVEGWRGRGVEGWGLGWGWWRLGQVYYSQEMHWVVLTSDNRLRGGFHSTNLIPAFMRKSRRISS